MRSVLLTGLGEAKIGYVSAQSVLSTLEGLWPADRSNREFQSLVRWAVIRIEETPSDTIKFKSDRPKGTDSRVPFKPAPKTVSSST